MKIYLLNFHCSTLAQGKKHATMIIQYISQKPAGACSFMSQNSTFNQILDQ